MPTATASRHLPGRQLAPCQWARLGTVLLSMITNAIIESTAQGAPLFAAKLAPMVASALCGCSFAADNGAKGASNVPVPSGYVRRKWNRHSHPVGCIQINGRQPRLPSCASLVFVLVQLPWQARDAVGMPFRARTQYSLTCYLARRQSAPPLKHCISRLRPVCQQESAFGIAVDCRLGDKANRKHHLCAEKRKTRHTAAAAADEGASLSESAVASSRQRRKKQDR